MCRDDALVKALSAIGMPVATGPAAVHRTLLQRKGSQAALLSPSYLRDFIQSHAAQAENSVRAERGHAAALLSYCLQDIDDSDADSCSALRGEELWHNGMWESPCAFTGLSSGSICLSMPKRTNSRFTL